MKTILQILLALTLLASPSLAQDDPNPKQILQDAAIALQSTPGFSAKVTLTGTGSKFILSTLPSMNARLTMGNHSEVGPVLRLLGELTPRKDAPPESFDALLASDRYIWIDHDKQSLNIRPHSISLRQRPAIYSYILLKEILNPAPFDSDLTYAQSFKLEPQQTVAGITCNVVLIHRAKPDPKKSRQGADSHTKERWFISTNDHLPRRVEQITDAGMIKATLAMELSGLTIAPQPDTDLYPYAPDTYTISDTFSPKPSIPDLDQPFTKPTTQPTPNPQPVQPSAPINPPAPNYTFTDTNNTVITRATQAGRLTVLYFSGSWCIPCKEVTPLIANLATEFANKADIFEIAIRESDPAAVIQAHQMTGSIHTLSVKSPSNLPSLFNVRIFPTIVVIDQASRIVYQSHLTKDIDATTLINNTKTAITKTLTP